MYGYNYGTFVDMHEPIKIGHECQADWSEGKWIDVPVMLAIEGMEKSLSNGQ